MGWLDLEVLPNIEPESIMYQSQERQYTQNLGIGIKISFCWNQTGKLHEVVRRKGEHGMIS